MPKDECGNYILIGDTVYDTEGVKHTISGITYAMMSDGKPLYFVTDSNGNKMSCLSLHHESDDIRNLKSELRSLATNRRLDEYAYSILTDMIENMEALMIDTINIYITIGGKSNDRIADEVIAGLWGNGDERYVRLTNAGYCYRDIQDIVNRKMRKMSNCNCQRIYIEI